MPSSCTCSCGLSGAAGDIHGAGAKTGVRSTEPGWTDNVIRYDGMASRAELVDSGGTTRYTWDGIRVLKTEDDVGTLKQRQVHGESPSGIPSVGDIAVIESSAGDAYVPEADQVGTITKILDSSATVANSYTYDAFGVARSAGEAFSNPYRFAGKPLDADPDLYHFVARQYDPGFGRFLARDRADYSDGMRLYAYVASRPARLTDPSGHRVAGLVCHLACHAVCETVTGANFVVCFAGCFLVCEGIFPEEVVAPEIQLPPPPPPEPKKCGVCSGALQTPEWPSDWPPDEDIPITCLWRCQGVTDASGRAVRASGRGSVRYVADSGEGACPELYGWYPLEGVEAPPGGTWCTTCPPLKIIQYEPK